MPALPEQMTLSERSLGNQPFMIRRSVSQSPQNSCSATARDVPPRRRALSPCADAASRSTRRGARTAIRRREDNTHRGCSRLRRCSWIPSFQYGVFEVLKLVSEQFQLPRRIIGLFLRGGHGIAQLLVARVLHLC